ncbi:hypothetical protein ABZX12_01935 [Kribbella sp. NPDC003505]|uniref:hypothetical protein n=1 Tax=Kribbella sp. NPDC003505 TaxID=3154448 RepID=UPI0033A78C67
MPEHETPRQTAERELVAAREEVRRMAESIRARLPADNHDNHDGHEHDEQQEQGKQQERQEQQEQQEQDKQPEQDERAGRWES